MWEFLQNGSREQSGSTPCLPRETRPTLGVILHVPWHQHGGPEEALAVFVAPAYLVASFGKLLCWARDAAVVFVLGAIATGLAEEGTEDTGECRVTPAMTKPIIFGHARHLGHTRGTGHMRPIGTWVHWGPWALI